MRSSLYIMTFEYLWSKVTTANSIYYLLRQPLLLSRDESATTKEKQWISLLSLVKIFRELTPILRSSLVEMLISSVKYKIYLRMRLCLNWLVAKPTRGDNILDAFIANSPYPWDKIKVFKNSIRTDHNMVIATPRSWTKATIGVAQFRYVRTHNKIYMGNLVKNKCNSE